MDLLITAWPLSIEHTIVIVGRHTQPTMSVSLASSDRRIAIASASLLARSTVKASRSCLRSASAEVTWTCGVTRGGRVTCGDRVTDGYDLGQI